MSVSWQPRRVSSRTSCRALTGTDVDHAVPPACGGVTSATYPSPFRVIVMAISRSPLLGRGHARSPGSRPLPAGSDRSGMTDCERSPTPSNAASWHVGVDPTPTPSPNGRGAAAQEPVDDVPASGGVDLAPTGHPQHRIESEGDAVAAREPQEMAQVAAETGAKKTHRTWDRVLVSAFLAGAYIAFGGLVAITVSSGLNPATWGTLPTLFMGAAFTLGLVLVL